jgi:hypothetical protein
LAAFAAPVRAIRQEEENPKFQEASALGAMHVVATTQRTSSVRSVQEQPKGTLHWERMIAPGQSGRNLPGGI